MSSDKIPVSLRGALAWASLTGRIITISYMNGRYNFEVAPASVSGWLERNRVNRERRAQQQQNEKEMKELLIEATAQRFYELTSVAVIIPWQQADEAVREKHREVAAWSHGGLR
ncbi:hypothetical protein SEA_NAMAGO_49 [Microbacterium phage Namago]|nr:hypothetical protein SEA_NAMAGO_49 [Microbacterium phage Namago]WKW84916.1 hypothetical protein SEA_SALLYK_50 [Microbacterium phage SallyK]